MIVSKNQLTRSRIKKATGAEGEAEKLYDGLDVTYHTQFQICLLYTSPSPRD